MKKVKQLLNNVAVRNLFIIAGMFMSFYILDAALRIFSNQYVAFYNWKELSPNLFTFSWIFLFIGILYLLPKMAKMITYSILVIISNILVYAEYLHYSILKRFFTFSDILLTKEGSDYFLYAISKTSFKIILIIIISLLCMVITLYLIKKTEEISKNKYYYLSMILITITLVSGTRILALNCLGKAAKDPLSWEAAYKNKNIYLDYNNQNKSFELSGVYELFFRSTYLYFRDNILLNRNKMIAEINDEINVNKKLSSSVMSTIDDDNYYGILKGKNVIYILMESIDSWLVTKDVMPTLYNLEQTGLNFTNRYSPSFGGGQTINSEFAMNTGLYAVENSKAIYNYDKNTFSESLASKLKDNNYSTISVHANSGSFYNRTYFHQALGYDKHYALADMGNINHTDYNYYNDSSLVKNDEVYNLIVREEPFFSFIISYSAHVPYDDTNDRCISNPYNLNVEGNKELSCIRNLAHETDEMLRILIERLKKDNLLDNTVLVLATDHYAYGYGDQASIKKFKNTNNDYLLQKVPLVIWSPNLKHNNIYTLMDTADILPTLLYMMGIDYNENYYIGTNVFSSNHDNFVYFSSDTFYDGKTLYDSNTKNINNANIDETIKTIRKKIDLNNKFIISDYFKSVRN
ncbi:MAG: sulfatase-like hydrolase/transferase [Tenericutes bacterium]|nr:sulfatase-like hydrolase/transferase [Mycoplasmatota bacterium]